jgi:hypothetical protein
MGLPALIGKSMTQVFKSIKDRVWKWLNDRKLKFLSQPRNEILLKAVVHAILTYNMIVFQLPKTHCKELNLMMRRFWWGHQEKGSKIHLMSWARKWGILMFNEEWASGINCALTKHYCPNNVSVYYIILIAW